MWQVLVETTGSVPFATFFRTSGPRIWTITPFEVNGLVFRLVFDENCCWSLIWWTLVQHVLIPNVLGWELTLFAKELVRVFPVKTLRSMKGFSASSSSLAKAWHCCVKGVPWYFLIMLSLICWTISGLSASETQRHFLGKNPTLPVFYLCSVPCATNKQHDMEQLMLLVWKHCRFQQPYLWLHSVVWMLELDVEPKRRNETMEECFPWQQSTWLSLSLECLSMTNIVCKLSSSCETDHSDVIFCDSLCVDNRSAPCFYIICISVKVMHLGVFFFSNTTQATALFLLNHICNQCNRFNCLLWDCAQVCCEATQICQSEVRLLFTNLELQEWSKQVLHLSDRPVDSLSVSSWLNTRLFQKAYNVGSSKCPKWSLKVCFILWKTYIPFFPFSQLNQNLLNYKPHVMMSCMMIMLSECYLMIW